MRQSQNIQRIQRVSANAIAAMLASDGWKPERYERKRPSAVRSKPPKRMVAVDTKDKLHAGERELMEPLRAGHPISWNALWGGDRIPTFPTMSSMGKREPWEEVN
ncbi:transcriptional regulator [Swingsia samuiensis]|uniref:Transcriptional regulator n=1 Tax=Swingsia samuiensis TaxID=1293412 RepID=A0A4Y6UJZ2_9PROT|nr:transcriptional regulator [Swingsia samuiensis]QDH16796.1 transcriptional regulator [Swingsia samuiensis]